MLELWGMWNTSSLPSLQCPPWLGVVALDRVLSMGQRELNCVLLLHWITWNRTVFDIETVLTLNWIIWNRTALAFNCGWTQTIVISIFWDTLSYFFLSFPLVWSCQLPISPSICRFPFLRAFWLLLDLVLRLLPSYIVFSFSLLTRCVFLCQIPFLYLNYILTVCFRVSIFFSFFGKQFDVVHVHQLVDLFLRFTELVSDCAFPKDVVE